MNSFLTGTHGLHYAGLMTVPLLSLGLFFAFVLVALTIVKALKHWAKYCPPNNRYQIKT